MAVTLSEPVHREAGPLPVPHSIREYPPCSMHPDSPMPELYRATLLKLLADQARAELVASDIYSQWVRRVPGPEEKKYLAEMAKEETEHWYKTVKLLEELGVTADHIRDYQSRHWFYFLSRVSIRRTTWLGVLMMSFLIDHAAYFLVEDFAQSSYEPWARMAREILEDEEGHPEMGIWCLGLVIRDQGKARVQRALHKWWRVALNMFGPPITKNTELYLRLGLKSRTNEARRQAFRHSCEPKILALGLEVPMLRRQSFPFF